MTKPDFYYIMAFDTTTDVIQAEKYASGRIASTIMPVPRELSSGCGASFFRDRRAAHLSILQGCAAQWNAVSDGDQTGPGASPFQKDHVLISGRSFTV